MNSANQQVLKNKGASTSEIQRHYDVGNEFYRLWLDEGMNYSCALWEGERKGDDLAQAQVRKLTYHIDSADASGKGAVLDIGCGWGAMLYQLSQVHNVKRCVGLTLSEEQANWVRARAMKGVEVHLQSWQDHAPEQPYDAIISIGAFEHFVRPRMTPTEKIDAYRAFFEKCASWLVYPGRLSLQTIAHGCVDEAKRKLIMEKAPRIFPGSALPRLQEIVTAAEDVFKITKIVNHANDYAQTCRLWRNNLKRNREKAIELQGESVYQSYVDYLQMSEYGFALENQALFRIVLEKPRKMF